MNLLLILGNQLFASQQIKSLVQEKVDWIFMREDRELCTYEKFHKAKIAFFLAAMRNYAQEVGKDFQVHYEKLSDKGLSSYEKSLIQFIKTKKVSKVYYFEIEDKFFEKRIKKALKEAGVDALEVKSPLFLTSREKLKEMLSSKRPFMKTFYEKRRKDLKILLTKTGEPVGGRWSFDTENRKALPTKIDIPEIPRFEANSHLRDVLRLVEKEFSQHPGSLDEFWLPTKRQEAQKFLEVFIEKRLNDFGPYEDALTDKSDFVFHSAISPLLNVGLLTPQEVIKKVIVAASDKKPPIASVEGFVRQVIGWREFVRGIYQNFSDKQESTNFFRHDKKLSKHWYEGNTGIPPLDQAISKVLRLGYNHHIERLMVIGNLMNLLEIEPRHAHRWFMEMYVDSSDWVMGPNVYGMALFSDGGTFATKPYICGSNFYCKMGRFKKGDWCDEVDGLYWGFVDRNRAFLSKNPRTSMMVKTLDRMSKERRQVLKKAADRVRDRLTL